MGRFKGQEHPIPKPVGPADVKPQKTVLPTPAPEANKGFLSKLFGRKNTEPLPRSPIEEEPEPIAAKEQVEPLIDYSAIPLHSGAFGPDVNLAEQNEAEDYDGELYYYVAVGE